MADSTFTRKYWESLAEPYGLFDSDSSDGDEAAEENEGGNDDDEGEGIDLTQPSPDNSDDEYHVEGDAGDLYTEVDNGFVVDDGEEQDGSDEDDDDYDEAEDGGVDEDYQMGDIPECEEEW
jgi:hypothetical protein